MKRVAQKGKKVDFQGKRCYVGVDVHKLTYCTALLSEDGMTMQFSSPADPLALIAQIREMDVEIICLAHESDPTGYESYNFFPQILSHTVPTLKTTKKDLYFFAF